MRRALALVAAGLVAVVLLVAGTGAGEDASGTEYRLVFDNAFGLTEGADLKIAGVKAGSVDKLDVERGTGRAIATVKVVEEGFDRLRTDATCDVSPQSLIGEYFVDCLPGRRGKLLPDGGRLGVERTTATIPPDAVASTLRRSQREQLRIILNEFGAGLAARGEDLNDTIRRGVPALRETERLLELLADNRRELRSLARESAVVLKALAGNRRDVGRFVVEARDSARASAAEQRALASTVRKLPPFLRELRPTLGLLGTAAERQTPALRDLRASAGRLTSFLELLAPFSDASTPALRTLGDASVIGRRAVRAADETVEHLNRFAGPAKEVGGNLALTLEHLDDRDNAVEPNKSAPVPEQGFTGLEAFLQYPFVQSTAINIFDTRGYTLKLNALINECGPYADAAAAKNPELREFCGQGLGPNQPGVTTVDPTAAGAASAGQRSQRGGAQRDATGTTQATATPQPPAASPAPPSPPAPSTDGGAVGRLLDSLPLLDYLLG